MRPGMPKKRGRPRNLVPSVLVRVVLARPVQREMIRLARAEKLGQSAFLRKLVTEAIERSAS